MGGLIGLIFSKLGALFFLAIGFLGMVLRMKWLRYRAERAEDLAEARGKEVEVLKADQKITQEVQNEKRAAIERVNGGGDFQSEFDRVRQRQERQARY